MVWHFVQQVKQSMHAVRNCDTVLEYITVLSHNVITWDQLQVKSARMKHYMFFSAHLNKPQFLLLYLNVQFWYLRHIKNTSAC